LTTGGVVADDLDAVIDAVAAIEDASGQATHIVGSPQSWADLSKFKQANNSNVSLVSAGTTAPTRTLLSVPVLASNSIADGTTLVLDRSTILSVYGSVMLATSQEFYFDSDSIGVRATFRFGARIANSERLVKLTVATPGS
jgi:HK97 family phage major capsid protein